MQLLPALEGGGVERSTLEIAAALVAAGHRSIVVSAGGRLVAPLVAAGSTHVALPIGAKRLRVLACVPKLRALVEAERPHLVHARSRLPAWIGRLALRGVRGPRPRWMTTVHGLNAPGRYSGVMASGERVVCVSETVRDHVSRHWPGTDPARLRVIPRGVDPAAWPHGHRPDAAWRAEFARRHPGLAGVPLLLLPGRGTRLKGHADAVRALALLATRHGIEAGLYLPGAREAGREAYVAEVESLAISLGVGGRVVFDVHRGDLREVYGAGACVLQVSRKPEAFGRTAVEALSIGVPVVGYAHGGIGEILGAAFPQGAVAVGDVDALADRVARFLREPPVVPPLHGFELAAMQATTLALYDELAGDAP
jgi:glycosyltransferase involved in cell wall biosynthesis